MQSIKLNTIKTQYRKKNFYSWTSERQPLLVYCASYRLGLACLYNNHGLLTSQMCSSYCLKQRHCRTWNSEGNKLHDRKLDIYKNILMFMVYCLCNFFCFLLSSSLHPPVCVTGNVDCAQWILRSSCIDFSNGVILFLASVPSVSPALWRLWVNVYVALMQKLFTVNIMGHEDCTGSMVKL